LLDVAALSGGFLDAPVQSSQSFRVIMNAMAKPGQIGQLGGATPPNGISVACGTLLLTLCDADTKVHLAGGMATQLIRDWLTFHTGAQICDAAHADFAIGTWQDVVPLTQYSVGTDQYPDRSCSLIVELPALTNVGVRLTGPGIRHQINLSLPDIAPFQLNAALFPLGCDFYFTAADRIAAMPRTSKVEDVLCM
jgi:alpha-D-ribose 1-methylphosphonate 5-triphosphate synthase subunit PhnH